MVWSNEKLQWERAKMVYRDELNMDKALTDRLLQLIPSEYKQEFTLRLQTEPNMRFQDAFQYFVTRYAQADEHDRSENKATMEWDWTINDDFPVIVKRLDDAVLFAAFAESPIPDHEVVDAGMKLLMKTGLFEREYEEWHARADGDKTWVDFKQFWPAKVQSKRRTQRTARQFGFGGMSVQEQASM